MHYIIIKTQFEGFHRYKDAPDQVSFLRDYHRHIFGVQAMIQVEHGNRQFEFFIIKQMLDDYLRQYTGIDNKFEFSCEQVASQICHFLHSQKLHCIEVRVSEDEQNIGGYLF